MTNYLYIDTETPNAGTEYDHDARTHFRLGQYAWNDGPVELITDYDAFVALVRSADYVVGHNIVGYDMSYLFGPTSLESLEMALAGKLIDTFVIASLVTPAPYKYTNRKGHTLFDAAKPERAKAYLALDNLAFQFDLPGKMGSLQELAKKYNPPKTLVSELDYGLIPVDDPEFQEYAVGDIVAVRALWKYLQAQIEEQDYPRDYIWRELKIWAINAQISRNGILVDQALAQARVDELLAERDEVMGWLEFEYVFPADGKAPWSTKAGKAVIFEVLADYGITQKTNPDWPTTPTGALKLGGEDLLALTEGTEAEKFGRAMATLKGQRSLAQLALDSTHSDGHVHPQIMCLQRSGRTSVQKPGLTVWTARGEGAAEKAYFIAEPGHVFVEMDYSAADARAVAAVSGDPEFSKRFEPGADSHDITGEIFFGYDEYHADRDNMRQISKRANHSLAYRVGVKKLAESVSVTVERARGFIEAYKNAYPWVTLWQDTVTREGDNGFVTNAWGRRMVVDPDRSFTQSSALIGQSTTREILFDGLIKIVEANIENARWLRATIHDAVLFCFPGEFAAQYTEFTKDCLETTFDPKTNVSQPIHFPVSVGSPAKDWRTAGH